MRTFAAFVKLSRPKFLLGGFAGFALGVAVAAYEGFAVEPAMYAAGQAMVTAFHLMTHYANDYFDRSDDRFTRPTEFAGGSGVLVSGLLAPRVALVAALICAAIGVVGAAIFALFGRSIVATLGGTIAILAWCYSAPPLRLAGRGWGELTTTAVVAILVPLTGYATVTGNIDRLAVAATAAPACAMLAMMIAVEWPDRDADMRSGKRNLLVRFGSAFGGRFGGTCALLVVPALWLATAAAGAPRSLLAFSVLLVPLVGGFARRIGTPHTAAGNVAAHGVSVFLLTVVFEIFAYVSVLR